MEGTTHRGGCRSEPFKRRADVDSLHRKGGKGKKGKGKGKNKGDRPRHDGKCKGEQPVKQRHFDGYCNQCGEYGHKKPDCAGKSKFFNGTRNKCGAHGHKRVDCPVKTVAHLESDSVTEPNEEPADVGSLEWLCALEHGGEEAMARLTSRAIYEMGNRELIELRQTSATILCLTCLKHVPEGLDMCQCGVWLRPNQSSVKNSWQSCFSDHCKRKDKWSQPMVDGSSKKER